MDPVSQGVLGATAAMAAAPKDKVRMATLIGWGAGMLADADVLIRSAEDPLLTITFHRHFSHSLIFIPIGALIAATLFWLAFLGRRPFGDIYKYSILGYATAGLLDACTSYGTQLLWPFSNIRVAWNVISIIDPVYTAPLLGLALFGALRKRALFGRVGLAFAVVYPIFGLVQNRRAMSVQQELIEQRGHAESASRMTVKPSIANLLVWRSIYRWEDQYYVDAARVGYLGGHSIFEGDSIPAVDARDLLLKVPEGSAIQRDIERFDHFSDEYLAWHPEHSDTLCDLRYSFIPNSLIPLWGIRLNYEDPDTHSAFINFRKLDQETRQAFSSMLWNSDQPLEDEE